MPKVSVVIPTYNRRIYVTQAVDSVFGQTFRDFEIIVVDDGSTDGTNEVLRQSYGQQIQYYLQSNQGESAARNRGIRYAKGEYVAFLDDDDLWLPQSLERRVEFMERHPHVAGVAAQLWLIDENGRRLSERPFRHQRPSGVMDFDTVILDSPMDPTSSLYRRRILGDVGLFDPRIRYGEDWDLALRIAATHPLAFIAEPLACRRVQARRQSCVMDAESANRRLADHIKIIEKAFQLPGDDSQQMARVRNAALAKEYAEAGVLSCLRRDYTQAVNQLARALELDLPSWRDGRRISELLFQQARPLARESGGAAARQLVYEVCSHLPPGLRSAVGEHCAQLMGELYIELAFIHASQQRWSAVRRNLIQGLRQDPAWLRNRGVLSLLADAFFPRRLTQPLRFLVNAVTPRQS